MTRSPFPNSPFSGGNLRTGLNSRFKQLYDAASFPLKSVGGTANGVTATLAPPLDGSGLLDGMSFTITWAALNTAGVTLAINGGSPVPVLGADGLALTAGSVGPGLRSQISYVGGNFVLLSPSLLMGGAMTQRYSWLFTASGTWVKPDDLPAATPVLIVAWGAGGGGSSNASGGAGGGGGYNERRLRAGDLPASVSVTVGLGGAQNSGGGNSTFGAFLTAYGGGRGHVQSNGFGGGGAGTNAAGTGATAGIGGVGGFQGGGNGGDGTAGLGSAATGLWGGGGGAGQAGATPSAGGAAVFGGGGGSTNASGGGVSLYGGNGGGNGQAGVAPGGGGGRQGAGARGEVRVYI